MHTYKYSEYHRSNPYIKIDDNKFTETKVKARKLFAKSLANESLDIIIHKQNSFIRDICYYYSISRECRMQLNSLKPFFHKKMWRTLKKKFGSKPKKVSFIKSKFIQKG